MAKSDCTKCRRCLLILIQSEEVPLEHIKQVCEVLTLNKAMNVMVRLSDSYIANKDRINMEKMGHEIEKIEAEYNEVQNCVQVAYDRISSSQVVMKIWVNDNNRIQASNGITLDDTHHASVQ